MKKTTYSPLTSSDDHQNINNSQHSLDDLELHKDYNRNRNENNQNVGDSAQLLERRNVLLQHFEIGQESKSDHEEIINNAEDQLQIERNWRLIWMILFFGLLFGVLASFALRPPPEFLETPSAGFNASTIAFGSCSSYDLRDLNIFTDAIIPSKPDAWIWAGDFVYLDETDINCAIFQNSQEWQMTCNCTATWSQEPPFTCRAGDVDYAQRRWMKGLNNGNTLTFPVYFNKLILTIVAPYNKFLEYMCPKSMEQGLINLFLPFSRLTLLKFRGFPTRRF